MEAKINAADYFFSTWDFTEQGRKCLTAAYRLSDSPMYSQLFGRLRLGGWKLKESLGSKPSPK
jgi:hypothetical protein